MAKSSFTVEHWHEGKLIDKRSINDTPIVDCGEDAFVQYTPSIKQYPHNKEFPLHFQVPQCRCITTPKSIEISKTAYRGFWEAIAVADKETMGEGVK